MNKLTVFVVTSNSFGHVYIIDRSSGQLLHTLPDTHVNSIYGVRIYDLKILATAGCQGSIKFHQFDEFTKPKLIYEEDRYQRYSGFTHLDNDGDKLVSGSVIGEVIAWDFKTGQKLHILEAMQRIMSLKVKWPLVVTCTIDQSTYGEKGIKLFNMENQNLIRHILACDYVTDVNIQGNVLMACSDNFASTGSVEKETAIRFWDLTQLMDNSIKIDKISNRKIQTEEVEALQICAMVGSNVFTTESNILVQRSFWP